MGDLKFRYAELRALPADVEETRTVEFVISDETRDRHGTVLKAGGWRLNNYKRNPVVGYMHDMWGGMFTKPTPDDVIGKSDVYQEGDKLIGRVTFEPADLNPQAEKVFRKILFGTLRTASVGFNPLKGWRWGKGDEAEGKKNATQYSDEHELLEWSIVNIPSNPKAGKRDFSEPAARFMEAMLTSLDGKVNEGELRKMTIGGIVDLLTGASLERDVREVEQSEQIDIENGLAEVDKDKVMRLKANLDHALAYHNTFQSHLDNYEEDKRKEVERDRRRRAREFNHYFSKGNMDFLKDENEDKN